MSIPRGTTPTFTLILPETVDLTQARNVYVSFRGSTRALTKSGNDIDVTAHSIDVYLDQRETLSFAQGLVDVQVNWTYANGRRAATLIKKIELTPNLLDKVVE